MLNSLKITNYKSWKNGTFDFVPGVNVIVGLSDKGKSAILTSFGMLRNNRPLGDGCLNDPASPAIIEGQFDNLDKSIILTRGKKNQYIIGEEEFSNITTVPEEITGAINMDDLNIQAQADSIFLLSQSPGEVARFFNRMANIDKIDSAKKYANSKVLAFDQEMKTAKKEAKRVEELIQGYNYIDTADIELAKLEQLEKDKNEKQVKVTVLKILYEQHIKLTNELTELKKTPIEIIEKEIKRLLQLDQDITALKEKYRLLKTQYTQYKRLSDELNQLNKIPVDKVTKETKRLLELLDNINEKTSKRDELQRLYDRYIRLTQLKENHEKTQVRLSAEYKKMKPKECSKCGAYEQYWRKEK